MIENTLERPGEFDALEKARPDELIFPLLERDPCAPPTIHHWVALRREKAREITDPDKLKAELMQCTEAEFIAFEMASRQRGGQAEAVETRASYSGRATERSVVEVLMSKARARLGEADFHASESLDLLRQLAEHEAEHVAPELIEEAAKAQATLHRIALTLSPYRAQYLAEGELPLPEPGGD